MRLSLVVPVLDEAAAIPALIEFLMTVHRAPECEVVIVDGGSTDGTVDLLRSSGLPWILAERGRALQMNAGAAATAGAILLFLHADTTLPPSWDRAVVAAANAGAVGGFFRVRLASDKPLLRIVGKLISLRSRLTRVATGDQALWVQRQDFERLGGFSPLPLFEDVDLTRRLKDLGPVAAMEATVITSARRWENAGPWRTIASMWALRALFALGVRPERLARYYSEAR